MANPATDAPALKNCPFCGGKAERVDIEDGDNAGGSFVHCTKCDASSNVEFEFKENFISNWNRRTPPHSEGLREALEKLVNAKALAGVRALVAGWNGEDRPEGQRYGRHPDRLGATLPKTNCKAVYELDEAMQAARAALSGAQSPWRPIAEADNSIATVQTFGEVTLINSYPVWVRDDDGRAYEAVWTEDRENGKAYWWDLEGESPVDPVEFYPHPLASRQGGLRHD